MIVGLRDRAGDASFSGGVGDVLLADAGGWFRTSPSFYRMTRTAYGALAADPSADVVVTTALDSTRSPYTGVAQWLDNATGRVLRTVTIYRAASSTGPLASEAVPGATCGGAFDQPGSASWTPPSDGSPDLATTGRAQAPQRAAPPVFGPSKVKGSMLADLVSLGDLESLCPPSVPTPTDEPTPTSTVPPTASATPWRTATRVPTGTPSPTATRVPTGTPTPTSVPGCIYLPVLHDERCVPEELHADVVLVLDLSTSMLRESAGSGSKLEGALVAARLFVGLLDLEPDAQGRFDRAGIVGFNDAAWTEVGLTSDGAALGLALDALPGKVAEGTRLDLALDQGQATLAAAPRTGVGTVMVLLTDGLPNRVPLGPGGSMVETVVERAAAARGTGTRVFTIGLGMPDDVLRGLLVAVASGPDDYYYAPTSAELADIYRQIAGRINECP
jgi:Mg-chelatase subunit ChlD